LVVSKRVIALKSGNLTAGSIGAVATAVSSRRAEMMFRYKKPYVDGSKPVQYGLIAEEVAEVYPDLVVRGKDGQMETVQYYKLDAMLLNEVQKLVKLHNTHRKEIAKLQAQMGSSRSRSSSSGQPRSTCWRKST
jgi:hypothetical protein